MLNWFAAGAEHDPAPLRETLLYQRARVGGRWLLVSTVVLALGELVARPGENPLVTALQLATAAGIAAIYAATGRARTSEQVVGLAMVGQVVCAAGSAAIAVATSHTSTSLIVLVALTSGAAAFMPWGWRPQALVAAWSSAMFPLEILIGGHGTLLDSSRELMALWVINASTVFIAAEFERQRRQLRAEQRQRQARERELEAQRTFLRQVIDINPHLLFAKDRDGRFTLVNRAVAAIYGSTVEDLIGRTDSDFNPNADEVAQFRRDDLAVIDGGGELLIAEERITDAAGRTRWLRTIKRPLVIEAGAAAQMLGVATDITEQKAAAAALHENAAITAALAHVGEGIIAALNHDDLLLRLCGLTSAVLSADSAQMWLLDAERGQYRPACHVGEQAERWDVLKLLVVPAAVVDEHRVGAERSGALWVPADQIKAPYHHLATGLHGVVWVALRRGGEPAGAMLITYRQAPPPDERELRIARGISQLASLAFDNARLHDELQRANNLKSEFMATMSHELRTPLNVIIGYCSLLIEGAMGELRDEQEATLQRMHENAVQLLELINATLDVSRLESGRIPLDLEPVDLAELVADVETRTRDLRDRSGVAFEWQIADGLAPIVTDAAKLRIVLTNLVGNAFKFTAHGRVAVRVDATPATVEIAVSDTGMGIPRDVQQAIFEPFRQADATIGTRYGGVGLGLFIVHRLIAALGGDIGVESEVGKGTTFRISLPIDHHRGTQRITEAFPL
jgi:PAS domain S-box-containing protein